MRPTLEMKAALDGSLSFSEVSPASISALKLVIYKHAIEVLALRTNDRKRAYIEQFPAAIQTMLKAECRRVYDQRKQVQ